MLINIVKYMGNSMFVSNVDEIEEGICFMVLSNSVFCVVVSESNVYIINVFMFFVKV